MNKRTRHIAVKFRFIHKLVKDKIVLINYCPSNEQLADIFTKPLNSVKFEMFRKQLLA